MKIAWFSPFSRRSAIGAFSATIVRELSAVTDVTVFASDMTDKKDAWLQDTKTQYLANLDIDTIPLQEFDICVYNLGDNINFHRDIYTISIQHPGIVILHDLVMHHFFSGYFFLHMKNTDGYLNELEYSHGIRGREFGNKVLNGEAGDIWMTPYMLEYNMARSAIRNAYGVIVHSDFALKELSSIATSPVIKCNFPLFGVSERNDRSNSSSDNNNSSKVKILTYGIINSNKLVPETIEAIGASQILRQNCEYIILGVPGSGENERINQTIRQNRLDTQVKWLVGHRTDDELHQNILNADILMSLRNPHFGETSSVLHECLTLGKATIVWKHGYYDEVPDDVVEKVDSYSTLQKSLEKLVLNPNIRYQLGERAREYALKTYDTARYASAFIEFAYKVRYNIPVLVLADQAAQTLAEQNAVSSDLVTQKILREILKISELPTRKG